MNLNGNSEAYTLALFPGDAGQFSIHEDNGDDKNYTNNFATTEVKSERKGKELSVTIMPTVGSYEDQPAEREYKLKLVASAMPESVLLNGKPVKFDYLGREFSVLVDLGKLPLAGQKDVKISFASAEPDLANGIVGKSRRLAQSIEQLKYRDAGIVLQDKLGQLGSINEAVLYHPENLKSLTHEFYDRYNSLPEILKTQKLDEATATWFLKSIGYG